MIEVPFSLSDLIPFFNHCMETGEDLDITDQIPPITSQVAQEVLFEAGRPVYNHDPRVWVSVIDGKFGLVYIESGDICLSYVSYEFESGDMYYCLDRLMLDECAYFDTARQVVVPIEPHLCRPFPMCILPDMTVPSRVRTDVSCPFTLHGVSLPCNVSLGDPDHYLVPDIRSALGTHNAKPEVNVLIWSLYGGRGTKIYMMPDKYYGKSPEDKYPGLPLYELDEDLRWRLLGELHDEGFHVDPEITRCEIPASLVYRLERDI